MLTDIKKKIISIKNEYNFAQKNSIDNLGKGNVHFNNYSIVNQRLEEQKAIQSNVDAFKSKLPEILGNVNEGKKNIKSKIEAIKYPNRFGDATQKLTSELQLNNALMFLSKATDIEILSEINNAFNNGRYDYAFHLIEKVSNRPIDRLLMTAEQKQFENDFKLLIDSFPDKKKIDALETEMNDLSSAEEMLTEFNFQLNRNKKYVILTGEYPYLTDNEKWEVLSYVTANFPGGEAVALKRKMMESIN